MAVPLTFGEAVAYVRRRQGLSQRALSDRAGLSASYVSKVEHGELEPSFRAFAQLAVALDLNAQEICVLVKNECGRAVGAA